MSEDSKHWAPEEREQRMAGMPREKAARGPQRNKPQGSWISRHRVRFAVLMFLVVGALVVSINVLAEEKEPGISELPDRRSVGSTTTSDDSTATPGAISITLIDVATLRAAFDENEVGANAQYKGAYVSVVGYITHIGQDDVTGEGILRLASSPGKIGAQVSCDFPDPDLLLDFEKGDYVLVRGTCTGDMLGIISIDECTVIEPICAWCQSAW